MQAIFYVHKESIPNFLVITHTLRLHESGLLVEGVRQILRYAQNDRTSGCHSERSEESLADFWVITSKL
ncbi:MAG: hypothetical protein ABI465_16715 [Ktedonobacteraceae bacterium]